MLHPADLVDQLQHDRHERLRGVRRRRRRASERPEPPSRPTLRTREGDVEIVITLDGVTRTEGEPAARR